MSASVVSESMVMNPSNNSTIDQTAQSEVEFANCDCCGLTEECTPAYIQRIRERYQGKWICGLCSEAVNYEMTQMRIMNRDEEEALIQHMSFCNKFKLSSPPADSAAHLISAMRSILRRSLDSPRSMPSSPTRRGRKLIRSGSYDPAVSPIPIHLHESSSGEREGEEKIQV